MKWTIGAALAALVSGCAFAPQQTITSSNYDYNVAFERAQNAGVLLNVLRSMDRKPMYFTAMSQMRGNFQESISTGGITIPFGPGDYNGKKYSAGPNASYTVNPSFDLAVLDTKSFWTGILTPASLSTLKYYWDQGWPQDLLLHVFVRTIKEGDDLYDNYPGDPAALAAFENKIHNLFDCTDAKAPEGTRFKCKLEIVPDEDDVIGPNFSKDKLNDPMVLIQAANAKLTVEPHPQCDGIYRLVPNKRTFQIVRQKDKAQIAAVKCDDLLKPQATGKPKSRDCIGTSAHGDCNVTLYLRSPEAMLYYLGEVARAQLQPDLGRKRIIGVEHCAGKRAPLFEVRKAAEEKRPSVTSVDYEGTTYVIPKDDNPDLCQRAVSTSTLNLALQLFAQLKETSDLPVTGAVTVVGPR